MWRYDKKVPLFDVPEKDVRRQVLVALDWIRDRRNARERSVPDKSGTDRLHKITPPYKHRRSDEAASPLPFAEL
jgi:hypothetical protein